MTRGKIERYHRSMKNVVKLEHYYYPWELEHAIRQFVTSRIQVKNLNVRVIKGGTVSKEHYITFNGKVLTEERLEKDLRIKLKDLKTALGV